MERDFFSEPVATEQEAVVLHWKVLSLHWTQWQNFYVVGGEPLDAPVPGSAHSQVWMGFWATCLVKGLPVPMAEGFGLIFEHFFQSKPFYHR